MSTPLPRVYRAEPWATGPAQVYDRLAQAMLECSPLALPGALLLDAGSGTGAVAAAASAAGARVVATDVALDMLRHDRDRRPPGVAADILALPLPDGCVDVAAAAFVLNHVDDPAAALRELGRVVRPGGAVLATTFAHRTDDVLKRDVDVVLAAHGYRPPPWYRRMKDELEPPVSRPELLAAVADHAGTGRSRVVELEIGMGTLDDRALAGFRLGAPAVAAYLDTLDGAERDQLWAEAEHAAAANAPYTVRMLVLSITRVA